MSSPHPWFVMWFNQQISFLCSMLFIITFFALFHLLTTSDYPPLVSSNFSSVFYDLWKVIAFNIIRLVFSRHLFLSCNKARWTHLMTIKCRGKTSFLCTKHPHFNINDAAMYCLGTGVRASGEFAHTYCTCQNCKIIGKVKMKTTGMWGLTLIILKDIKFEFILKE